MSKKPRRRDTATSAVTAWAWLGSNGQLEPWALPHKKLTEGTGRPDPGATVVKVTLVHAT